jgi:hypothetical protein
LPLVTFGEAALAAGLEIEDCEAPTSYELLFTGVVLLSSDGDIEDEWSNFAESWSRRWPC